MMFSEKSQNENPYGDEDRKKINFEFFELGLETLHIISCISLNQFVSYFRAILTSLTLHKWVDFLHLAHVKNLRT